MNHGTRSAYVRGCRCDDCRRANREYARLRERRVTAPDVWGPATDLVSAAPARRELERLRGIGLGLRQVSASTGVSRHALVELQRGVTRRTHPSTIALLESITADEAAEGILIDAAPTWRYLEALIAAGYSKARIATLLGHKRALQIHSDRIRRSTERAVRELYERLWREDLSVRVVGVEP